jgi:hypothetical protein
MPQSSLGKLNGCRIPVSGKVHLDEIVVMASGGDGTPAAFDLIACRWAFAPI